MLDQNEPTISHELPNWLPVVAAIGIIALIGGSMISATVSVKVFTAALTAAMAYVAVCFTCRAVAMLCDVLGGLGSLFHSWRS